MNVYKGTSIANGVGLGKLHYLRQAEVKVEEKPISAEILESELALIDSSLQKASASLEALVKGASSDFTEETLDIFRGHIELLEDDELKDEIKTLVKEEKYNALWATNAVFGQLIDSMASRSEHYMQERAADFRDLRDRILRIMAGYEVGKISFKEDVILLTGELTPSDTISLDLANVKGFITTVGGVTSHAAIISRTLGLPALVLPKEQAEKLQEGQELILDAFKEELYSGASADQIAEYKVRYEELKEEQARLGLLKDKPCQTKDGERLNLLANIGSPEDGEKALEYNPDGVGLFRSEFLFMESSTAPSEESQFQAYSKVIKQYAPRPVTIRTLDIGGDKEIPYLAIPKEENPFLGWRAVRMYEEKSALMMSQFRAILRSSVEGMIKIMVPMAISEEEVLTFRRLLNEAQVSLEKDGIAFKKENVKVGIMVETPATALIADSLAHHVDFFSLGTNDLTQYTLAVDRGNAKVANLFSSYHPSVLKLINMTAEAGRKTGAEVSVCGEFASDERGCLLLAGMGIVNLSMTASLSLQVKDALSKVNMVELKELTAKALALSNSEAVTKLVDTFRREHGII